MLKYVVAFIAAGALLGGLVAAMFAAPAVPGALVEIAAVVGGEDDRLQCSIMPQGSCTENWTMSSTCTVGFTPPCGDRCDSPGPNDRCKNGPCSNEQPGRYCKYPNDQDCIGASASPTNCGQIPLGKCKLIETNTGEECVDYDAPGPPYPPIPGEYQYDCEEAPCETEEQVNCIFTECTG